MTTLSADSHTRASKSYDYVFKLLVIGDSSVGKTCILVQYCENAFYSMFIPTIGIDFKVKTIKIDGKTVKLQIWDTAGQDRFRTITTAYYRGAMGIIFVYDVTNAKTFENLKFWLHHVDTHAYASVERLMVGNKCDMNVQREVTYDEAIAFARPRAMRVLEVSAKTGENINLAFSLIARDIKRKLGHTGDETTTATASATNRNSHKRVLEPMRSSLEKEGNADARHKQRSTSVKVNEHSSRKSESDTNTTCAC